MPDFKDLNSLFKYIEKSIPISLEQVGEQVKQLLRDNVQRLWYDRPFTPTHYTRTMEYIESITVSKARKIGNGYEVLIYFDTDKIKPYPSENGEWSKHQSITTGTNINVYIPLWIEEGQNSPIYAYEGVRPVGTTIDYLEESSFIKKRMSEFLKKHGFNVK